MHVSCRHLRQMCNHGEVRKHPWSWINWEKISPARARGGVGGWWWWWWWRAATIQQIEGLMEHLLSPGLIHGYGMLLVFFYDYYRRCYRQQRAGLRRPTTLRFQVELRGGLTSSVLSPGMDCVFAFSNGALKNRLGSDKLAVIVDCVKVKHWNWKYWRLYFFFK